MEAMTDWDALWKRGGFNRWPNEDLVRWASTLEPESKVLEIGCGAGANLRALEEFGHEAWGVDLSVEALEASVGLTRATREAPVSATELPFDDGEFDAVCDVQCFQHLAQDELPLAYREAARVLKPGGRFFEVFLTEGQEHFPALSFCQFEPWWLEEEPWRCVGHGYTRRYWGSRDYLYQLVECEHV